MNRSLFESKSYKAYLTEKVKEQGRGAKSRLAEVLRCHLAYVSQVLNGDAHFSLEQADILNRYLNHTEDEADFFLLLVLNERAGTDSLRKLYDKKIKLVIQERSLLENRIQAKKTLPAESQAIYYSAWYYAAIHLLISIPGFQTREEIARALRLHASVVSKALEFLVSNQLIDISKGRYSTGHVTLFLSNDSPWISRHHANWRMQCLRAFDRPDPKSLHYTSVVTMSEADAPTVRKIMVEAIEKVRAVVKDSPEKNLYCYTVDFFGV